jgi:hypothetical protein
MIGEMIIWGFFSAIGWMGANWTVNKIFPDAPPAQTQPVEKNDRTSEKSGS